MSGLRTDPSERIRTSVTQRKSEPPRKRPPVPRNRKKSGGGGKRPRRSWWARLLLWSLTLCIWGTLGLTGIVLYYAKDMPDLDLMTATTRRPSITFYSTDGEVIASYGDIYGDVLGLQDLPPALISAVLSTEDRRFYSHFGVDVLGVARAMVRNIKEGRMVQGGSGITQQLAKNLFLTPERSLKRKVQELLLAFWLERRFTKEQILTLYLNRVYLGAGTYGVDAAARRYFEKSARDLSIYEAAMLAGLLKGPSYYNPFVNPERSNRRTIQVLNNMVDSGSMSAADAKTVQQAGPPKISSKVPPGRYFADWVYEQVASYAGQTSQDLVVYTTLTLSLQRQVETEMEALLAESGEKSKVTQGAVLIMTPTGAIRAMAGGRSYSDSQFNRATQAKRQPGSTFKPFVYLAALESGMTPETEVEDGPITEGSWRPKNYVNRYDGFMTLRTALARSINTVVVRLIKTVGPRKVVDVAKRIGIVSKLQADASLALGTSEVSLLELTGAYAVFSNGGQGVLPYGIAEIRTSDGKTLFRREGSGGGPVVAPTVLYDLVSMLSGVIDDPSGTGKRAKLSHPAAGKSGTTQDYRDAWFVGFTADLVGGVWLGNDDGTFMNKVTGGNLPAQLWQKVMTSAHKGIPVRPLRVLAAGTTGVIATETPTSLLPSEPVRSENPVLKPEEQAQWESLLRSLAEE